MGKGKIVCVVGTTATGKTDLAVEICKEYHGEVISADSMQIYRGFDIGTAKVTQSRMGGIKHHLIDIVEPDGTYSVADWCSDACAAADKIIAAGRLPVVAGGTGLYVSSLTDALSFKPLETDAKYREELNRAVTDKGADYVWSLLNEVDPDLAARIHPNNTRRVIRGLEVWRATGRPLSELAEQARTEPRYESLKIGLRYSDRAMLYSRINARVDEMMADGLENEVRVLLDSGISPECQSMQAIGYKELVRALQGKVTLESAVDKIKQASRNYAKRQIAWFARDPDIRWFDVDTIGAPEKLFDNVKNLLEIYVNM